MSIFRKPEEQPVQLDGEEVVVPEEKPQEPKPERKLLPKTKWF